MILNFFSVAGVRLFANAENLPVQFHWSALIAAPLVVWFVLFVGGFIFLCRRRLFFFPQHVRLRDRGIDLFFAGQTFEAERCYREALQLHPVVPSEDRRSLLVCLGDALIDQRRYPEAKECLEKALEAGDPTGSCQITICDLLLLMKVEGERALEMAEVGTNLLKSRAHLHIWGAEWNSASRILAEVSGLARKARALALLSRNDEARATLDQALKIAHDFEDQIAEANPNPHFLDKLAYGRRTLKDLKFHPIAEAHWQIGLAFLAIDNRDRAAQEFSIVTASETSAGVQGRYRRLVEEKLADLANESQ